MRLVKNTLSNCRAAGDICLAESTRPSGSNRLQEIASWDKHKYANLRPT